MSEAVPLASPTPAAENPLASTPTGNENAAATGTPAPTATPGVAPATPGSLLGTEPSGDGTKPGEPEAAKPPAEQQVAADINAITLPEGLTLPDEIKGSLSEIAKEHGLTQPAAQKLIDLHAQVAKQNAEASVAQWAKLQTQWVEEVKAMPEFTGEKLGEAQTTIARALSQHGSPEVRQAFDLTGAGSNPHIFKFIHSLAKALGEGGSAPAASPPSQQKSAADLFYPGQK